MRARVLHVGLLVSTLVVSGCTRPPADAGTAGNAAPAAQETAPPESEDVQNTVSQLEHDWVNAIVKKDVATLERVIADDFVGISSSGGAYTKTLAIDDVRGGQYVVEKMELTEVSVTPFGTTAIAFTTQDEASHYGTTNTSGRYRYMDVWMQRNGGWQVVASHGAKAE